MTNRVCVLALTMAVGATVACHAETPVIVEQPAINIPAEFLKITTDRRIVGAVSAPEVRSSLDRLTRNSYRMLLLQTRDRKQFSGTDRRTLGTIYELLDQPTRAIEQFRLAIKEHNHLGARFSLVRVLANIDPQEAESELAAAKKQGLEPAQLAQAQRALALGFQQHNQWQQAARYFDKFLKGPNATEDDAINGLRFQRQRDSAESQLARATRIVSMIGKSLPTQHLQAWHVAKDSGGDASQAKVVLIDFFAIWSDASRRRITLLKTLQEKYTRDELVIVGITKPNGYFWNASTGKGRFRDNLDARVEARSVQAYFEKNEIDYGTFMTNEEIFEWYAAAYLPQTLILDSNCIVRAVIGRSATGEGNKLEVELQKVLNE